MPPVTRRTFLAAASAGAALGVSARARGADANDSVVLAVMGVNNRGSHLAEAFVKQPGVRIAYVCDPDERAIGKGVAAATSQGAAAPQGLRDFRKALDDPAVDALVCAAPNHWHAPATILACAAGKHVYVEKPCSHSAHEGEMMIAAARSANRVVQVGTQRRSGQLYQDAIAKVRGGALGETLLAKSWYYAVRPSIGRGQETAPPAWLDYDLWQGPAPERAYRDNQLHYNWHFFWNWGDGELGNNGVHGIDICRWGLGVDFPTRTTVCGGRVRYDDDQETPDTSLAMFQCGGKVITWEQVSWSRTYPPSDGFGVEFRGAEGTMHLDDSGFTIVDGDGKEVEKGRGDRGDDAHLADFLNAVRSGGRPNADIEEGHKSALFCHVGNISYRTGRTIETQAETGEVVGDDEAKSLWRCQYRSGWEPRL